MGYIYLIGEIGNDNIFKIGSTKKNNIEDRKKELQTGNSNELYIKDYFKTDKPFKLETMLHFYYQNDNKINEWFVLDEEKQKGFHDVCVKYQNIIESLNGNPFFQKKK